MKQIAFSCVGVKFVKIILFILLIIIMGCEAHPPQQPIIVPEPQPIIVPEPLDPPIEKFNPDTVSKLIQEKITKSSGHNRFMHRSELIHGISLLPSFYQSRKFSAAWMETDGEFLLAEDLLEEIKDCKKHALDPENYHYSSIETLLKTIRDHRNAPNLIYYDTAADLDILLTEAFFLFSSHLLFGIVNPETLHIKGEAYGPDIDLVSILNIALKYQIIRKTLKDLSPQHQEYLNLQLALKKYQEMASKNDPYRVPVGETLRYGASHERVRMLRNRLIFLGDLKATETSDPTFFDSDLEKAVKSFQFRHGLVVDGVAGRQTIAAMNVSSRTRLSQIELNMERCRWLPRKLGTKYILVNIADFKLSVVEHGQSIIEMRVVVGKPYRKTPVFSEKMLFLAINPFWNVPIKLAIRDLAPRICSDPGYLAAKQIKVYKNWQRDSPEIDPALISWCTLTTESYFPYKLQQASCPDNPLGKIKFIFPNKYAVYLHDTPDKSLFDKNLRDLSSGCIRVEKPFELAKLLLGNPAKWNQESIKAILASKKPHTIRLPEHIPVLLLYWTVAVDQDGKVHFKRDPYNRDKAVLEGLEEEFKFRKRPFGKQRPAL